MTNKEVYKIWAPYHKKWTNWVRPVPFIYLDENINEFIDYNIPHINYLSEILDNTAIIIDINGIDSIKEGIELAKIGYRPIPIFNGTSPNKALSTTNNKLIEPLLIWGALELQKIKLKDDSLPVFLLDDNRLNRYKINRGIFDNSWDVYYQDLPSSKYFLNNNINKILVRANKINKDLNKILYDYQKNNIKILFTNGFDPIKEIKIKKINYIN